MLEPSGHPDALEAEHSAEDNGAGAAQPVLGSSGIDGQRLGDFRLRQLLGRGSQGEVWLAEDSLGRRVAIKRLFAPTDSSRPHREEQALRLYQGLSDELHLLRVLHVGRTESGLFYSMELADTVEAEDGRTRIPVSLAHLLSTTGALGSKESKRVISDVLEGVAALHARDLLHRDIKPSNILQVNGVWKLADIGLLTEDRTEVTALGTVEFMPSNGNIDRTADLYACGRVLYCMLTGLPARSFPTLPKSVLTDTSPEVRALNAAVNRACALEPTRRFQSAAEFKDAINHAERDVPVRWGWVAVAAVCALATAGWGGHRYWQRQSPALDTNVAWQSLFDGHSITEWDKPLAEQGTWFIEDGAIRCVRDAQYKLLRLNHDFGPGTLRVVASPDHDGARFGIRYACNQPGGGPLFMLMGDKYTWLKGHKGTFPPDQPGNWFSFPGPIPAAGEEVVFEVEWGPTRHQLRANGQVLYDLPPSGHGGPLMLHVWADDSATFHSVEYRSRIEK